MNEQKFHEIYSMPRNGANTFYRHPLARSVLLSDGITSLAETGCWWLIDLIALEGYPKLKRNPDAGMLIVKVKVKGSVASIQGKLYDDKPPSCARRSTTPTCPRASGCSTWASSTRPAIP